MYLTLTFRNFLLYISTATQWNKISAFIFISLLGVGLGVGFSISGDEAKRDSDKDYARRLAIFSEWQMEVSSRLTRASAIAGTIAAFGMVNATVPANLTAPKNSRMSFVNDEGFQRLAKSLQKEVPGITTLVLAPGGVASQFYPNTSGLLGLSLYDSPIYRPMFDRMMTTGKSLVSGPSRLILIDGFAFHAWHPVFVSDVPSPSSFWGIGLAMLEMNDLMRGINISTLYTRHGLDYALWFEESDGSEQTILSSASANVERVKREGMRMRLPVGEGKPSYLAMFPSNGPVSSNLKPRNVAIIVVSTLIGALLIVSFVYAVLMGIFVHRHRHAPEPFIVHKSRAKKDGRGGANRTEDKAIYVAVLMLRGAQPIFEKSPLEGVVMVRKFIAEVKILAKKHGCYSVCEIGDRTTFVVSRDPDRLMRMCQESVTSISLQNSTTTSSASVLEGDGNHAATEIRKVAKGIHRRGQQGGGKSLREGREQSHSQRGRNTNNNDSKSDAAKYLQKDTGECVSSSCVQSENDYATTVSAVSRTLGGKTDCCSESSFTATTVCRISAACHVATRSTTCTRVYDAARDKYFFGTNSLLSKLCSVVDQTQMGEVAWTEDFDKINCKEIGAMKQRIKGREDDETTLDDEGGEKQQGTHTKVRPFTLHTIVTGGTTLNVASWWRSTGEERDNEDPSVAVALLGDAYVKRMIVVAAAASLSRGDNSGGLFGSHGAKKRSRRDSGSHSDEGTGGSGSGNKSTDATSIARNATILHIAIPDNVATVLDICRKIVIDEKGAIVNAHDLFIVAAFNLLAAGGHHQLRAAEAVHRIQNALAGQNIPFVCSIHFGKVDALLVDGLVLCTGEAVTIGRHLVLKALDIATSPALQSVQTTNTINLPAEPSSIIALPAATGAFTNSALHLSKKSTSAMMMATTDTGVSGALPADDNKDSNENNRQADDEVLLKTFTLLAPKKRPIAPVANGLCVLFCQEEMSSLFDCEPIDVMLCPALTSTGEQSRRSLDRRSVPDASTTIKTNATSPYHKNSAVSVAPSLRPRIIFRLAHRKASNSSNIANDEWMYQLRELDDGNAFSAVTAVFNRILIGQMDEAARLWQKLKSDSKKRDNLAKSSDAPKATLLSSSVSSLPPSPVAVGPAAGYGGLRKGERSFSVSAAAVLISDEVTTAEKDKDRADAETAKGEVVSEMAALSLNRIFASSIDQSSGHTF